jgi:hypothetical protein
MTSQQAAGGPYRLRAIVHDAPRQFANHAWRRRETRRDALRRRALELELSGREASGNWDRVHGFWHTHPSDYYVDGASMPNDRRPSSADNAFAARTLDDYTLPFVVDLILAESSDSGIGWRRPHWSAWITRRDSAGSLFTEPGLVEFA